MDGEEIVRNEDSTKILYYEKNDDGTYTETEREGYKFNFISDPTKADTDEDGIDDQIDPLPLYYGISECLPIHIKDNLISELKQYIDEDLNSLQGLITNHTLEEAVQIIYEYDSIITESSNYYMLPKAYIQAVLLRELIFENILDSIADEAVIITHTYINAKEIYDNLDWYSKLFVQKPVYPILIYKEDSSTGLGQIFAGTAISALNYLNKRNNINITYNYENWRERYSIWNKLRTNNEYNVSMIANILVFRAISEINIDNDFFLGYSEESRILLLARYNGTNDSAKKYGKEVYRYYEVFEKYN